MQPLASIDSWLLLNIPTFVLGIAIVAISIGVALGGLVLVRRSVELRSLESHHDVAGFVLAVVGVVYAVLLAFVVVVTWEQFEDARATADTEASLVGSLYRDSFALDTGGARLRVALEGYADSVVDDEWPEMSENQRESPRTDAALNSVWTAIRAAEPKGDGSTVFYDEAVSRLLDATQDRRTRLLHSGNSLPAPVWWVLIFGAVICVAFTYLFGVERFKAQAIIVGALAGTIGLVLFLILALDLPFTGDVGVGPTAMEDVIGELPHYGR